MKRLDQIMDIIDDRWEEERTTEGLRTRGKTCMVNFMGHLMYEAAQLRVRLNSTKGKRKAVETTSTSEV